MDFQFDATADGRRLRFCNALDQRIRLCLAIRVGCRSRPEALQVRRPVETAQAAAA